MACLLRLVVVVFALAFVKPTVLAASPPFFSPSPALSSPPPPTNRTICPYPICHGMCCSAKRRFCATGLANLPTEYSFVLVGVVQTKCASLFFALISELTFTPTWVMLLSSMTWFLKRSLLVWLSECLRRRKRGGSEDATIFAARKARAKQVILLGMTIKNVLCLVFAFVVAIVKAKQAVKYSGLSKWRSYLYYCSIVLNVGVCSSVAATMYEGMLFRAPNRQQVSELQVISSEEGDRAPDESSPTTQANADAQVVASLRESNVASPNGDESFMFGSTVFEKVVGVVTLLIFMSMMPVFLVSLVYFPVYVVPVCLLTWLFAPIGKLILLLRRSPQSGPEVIAAPQISLIIVLPVALDLAMCWSALLLSGEVPPWFTMNNDFALRDTKRFMSNKFLAILSVIRFL
eukprot:c20618_g1_i1.p1 GENE.c20618_g1_i1~~c20618_g1_i1.p1  ORF type:complete len:404 (+),score=30.94 c20618_g1_i1:112-1323(+)